MLVANAGPAGIRGCKPLAPGREDESPPRWLEPFTALRAAAFSVFSPYSSARGVFIPENLPLRRLEHLTPTGEVPFKRWFLADWLDVLQWDVGTLMALKLVRLLTVPERRVSYRNLLPLIFMGWSLILTVWKGSRSDDVNEICVNKIICRWALKIKRPFSIFGFNSLTGSESFWGKIAALLLVGVVKDQALLFRVSSHLHLNGSLLN